MTSTNFSLGVGIGNNWLELIQVNMIYDGNNSNLVSRSLEATTKDVFMYCLGEKKFFLSRSGHLAIMACVTCSNNAT